MLYLSQLLVNGRSREARGDLSDCRALHQRILSAFPDAPDVTAARERFGVLYRAEPVDGGARILVQSRERPDWSRLPVGYLRAPQREPKRIDERYAAIEAGQILVFRLRANPTQRISNRSQTAPERWRGKRVELRTEQEQLAWLKRKGEANGFTLLAVRVATDIGMVTDLRILRAADRVTGQRAGQQLTFASVVFEGRLRVANAELLRAGLAAGIGSGKAFGFGLLSVAPATATPRG